MQNVKFCRCVLCNTLYQVTNWYVQDCLFTCFTCLPIYRKTCLKIEKIDTYEEKKNDTFFIQPHHINNLSSFFNTSQIFHPQTSFFGLPRNENTCALDVFVNMVIYGPKTQQTLQHLKKNILQESKMELKDDDDLEIFRRKTNARTLIYEYLKMMNETTQQNDTSFLVFERNMTIQKLAKLFFKKEIEFRKKIWKIFQRDNFFFFPIFMCPYLYTGFFCDTSLYLNPRKICLICQNFLEVKKYTKKKKLTSLLSIRDLKHFTSTSLCPYCKTKVTNCIFVMQIQNSQQPQMLDILMNHLNIAERQKIFSSGKIFILDKNLNLIEYELLGIRKRYKNKESDISHFDCRVFSNKTNTSIFCDNLEQISAYDETCWCPDQKWHTLFNDEYITQEIIYQEENWIFQQTVQKKTNREILEEMKNDFFFLTTET